MIFFLNSNYPSLLTPNRSLAPNFPNPLATKLALQNTLSQYPLATTLLANGAFKSALHNHNNNNHNHHNQQQRVATSMAASFLASPVSTTNVSSASSGYSTSDEACTGAANDTANKANESLGDEAAKLPGATETGKYLILE